MNQQIKNIYSQLWENISIRLEPTHGHPENGWGWAREHQKEVFSNNMQMFAEAIIKECAGLADRWAKNAVGDLHINVQPSEQIFDHFGVDTK